MKYEKPQITLTADAVEAVQGPKTGGPADSAQPHNPVHTPAAYESDEYGLPGRCSLSSPRQSLG